MEGVQVYSGESRAFYLDGGVSGISEHTSVNLQEITNRLTISVEGLDRNEEEINRRLCLSTKLIANIIS